MPFSTGTAKSAVDLQAKLNTFLTANGWTKIVGDPDQAVASPKAARYWRILVLEVSNIGEDYREFDKINFHTTIGGANVSTDGASWTVSNANRSTSTLVTADGTTFITDDLDDDLWWGYYDFGSPTIVREVEITCGQDYRGPREFYIQWSNDTVTWTTMWGVTDEIWSGDYTTKVFNWPDGYRDAQHAEDNIARRTGKFGETYNRFGDFEDRMENGYFLWQGPGYDASRRVYVGCMTNYSLSELTERWIMFGATEFNAGDEHRQFVYNQLDGGDPDLAPRFLIPVGEFTYWFYCNSTRIIVIVKNGLDDYLSTYAGFLKAFAQPEDYSFPLYIAGTAEQDRNMSDTSAVLSSMCDPGDDGCARVRKWDGAWYSVENRWDASQIDLYNTNPDYYVWPYHCGFNGDGDFPGSILGDNDSFTTHWMSHVVPTAQDELAIFPCLVTDRFYGYIGAIDGVFALPRGESVSAEQVITIGGQDYRVFTNRNRSNGNHYFVVRED